jgi:predicted RNase H-like nuclease (RuvC/YqgF family)
MDNEPEKNGENETAAEEPANLQEENEALSRELRARDGRIVQLEQALSARDAQIEELKRQLAEAGNALDELGKALPQAVAAYKEILVAANPGVLPEMISGDSIEAVNESLQNARNLMERVRQEMENEAAKTRVPAGAPPRTPPDLSALSPREKIQYALGGAGS